MIIFIPLFIGGVSEKLLNATMRGAGFRIEQAIVYVKEPYASLIPISASSLVLSAPEDYFAFDKTLVLFKGFGKTTVISFAMGNAEKKLEIPNDQIIIVHK